MNIPLSLLAPPIVGAFIGYLTNKIAIRMLFRPLKPWFVLGIKVPMTPGIIPSKRGQLADNIGEMVGTHLLTHKDIGAALSKERFQDHLSVVITTWLTKLLQTELGSINELVPPHLAPHLQGTVQTLKNSMHHSLHEYISSDDLSNKVTLEVNIYFSTLDETSIDEFISRTNRGKIYQSLSHIISNLLSQPTISTQLSGYFQTNITQAAIDGKTVGDILPDSLKKLAREQIKQKSPVILGSLAHLTAKPLVQARIITAVNSAIENFVASLGPLGAMAGNFLDGDVISSKIKSFFDDKEGKVTKWLQDPSIEKEFTDMLLLRLQTFLSMPVANLLQVIEDKHLQIICDETAEKIISSLTRENSVEQYYEIIETYFENLCEDGKNTTGSVLSHIFIKDDPDSLKHTIANGTTEALRSLNNSGVLNRIGDSLVETVLEKPIGRLDKLIPTEIQQNITSATVRYINQFLIREVPGLVDSLNIRRIVIDKVNTLDLLQLERLLLSIMEEQFKYINLFGALLGFIIGLLNAVFLSFS